MTPNLPAKSVTNYATRGYMNTEGNLFRKNPILMARFLHFEKSSFEKHKSRVIDVKQQCNYYLCALTESFKQEDRAFTFIISSVVFYRNLKKDVGHCNRHL